MCRIKWSQKVNVKSVPTHTNPIGRVYRRLDFDVEMTCEDGTVDFTIYRKGKRVATQNVEVDFD